MKRNARRIVPRGFRWVLALVLLGGCREPLTVVDAGADASGPDANGFEAGSVDAQDALGDVPLDSTDAPDDVLPVDAATPDDGPSDAGACSDGGQCNGTCVDLASDETHCGACGTTCPTGSYCNAGHCAVAVGCNMLHAEVPTLPSGLYQIDPDGAGSQPAFAAYCDMARNGGGWALVAKIGRTTPHGNTIGPFAAASTRPEELATDVVAPDQFAYRDFRLFDAYGVDWSLRATVDATGDGSSLQHTFFRPHSGATSCAPSLAGSNWYPSGGPQCLEYLVMSSTMGMSNTTWLPIGTINFPSDPSGTNVFFLGVRDESGTLLTDMTPCIDLVGQTQRCHGTPGFISSQSGLTGVPTAYFGLDGDPAGSWTHDGTYWIRDGRGGATP